MLKYSDCLHVFYLYTLHLFSTTPRAFFRWWGVPTEGIMSHIRTRVKKGGASKAEREAAWRACPATASRVAGCVVGHAHAQTVLVLLPLPQQLSSFLFSIIPFPPVQSLSAPVVMSVALRSAQTHNPPMDEERL